MDIQQELSKKSLSGKLAFLFKDSFFYGAASAITKLIYVVTLPIYARFFSKSEFAVVDSITVLGFIFLSVIIMGQDSSVARYFYESESEEDKKQIVIQSLAVELIMSLVFGVLLWLNAELILSKYLSNTQYIWPFKILVLSLPFRALVQFWQNLLKWTFSRNQYFIMTIGLTAVLISAILASIFFFKMGVVGVFYANLFAFVVFSIVGAVFCRKYLILPNSFHFLNKLLSFGWPFMLLGVIGQVYPSIDRYFITKNFNLEMLGIYAVAYRISMVLSIPINGFQIAWGPFAYSIYKNKDAHETYDKVFFYYVLLLTFLATGMVLFARPVTLLFASDKFDSSIIFLLPLAFSITIDSFSWITGIGVELSKKSHLSVYSYIISLAGTTAGVWLFIKPWGLMGVAMGILLGKVLLTVSKTYIAYKAYPPLRFGLKKAGLVFTLGLGISVAYNIFSAYMHSYSYLLSGGLMLAFAACIWYMIVDKKDKNAIQGKVGTILKPVRA